jgi:glycosyltransferase involved in cell wall biosynthesis
LAYYKKYFRLAAQQATRVATVSEYSKGDIAQLYQIDARKIDVVYNGVNDFFHPLGLDQQQAIRAKISRGAEYFAFVGALNPRKNIVGMLQSFDQFKKNKASEVKLVIVGEKMYWSAEMENCFQAMEYKHEVIFVGRKQGQELNEILASSIALWFVSHFEGFGIPLIEAFKAGTAAIASTKTSLPEVGAEAALYAEPDDVEDIAAKMELLACNPALRLELIEKGRTRAQDFTWEKSAERLWESMMKALKK